MVPSKNGGVEMSEKTVSKASLGRMPKYLQFLKETSSQYISSAAIARELSLGEVQVRKDLNSVCGTGKPKIGYLTKDLINSIEKCLGNGDVTNAVLVGAGKLGRALLDYGGFAEYGIKIIAAFDNNAMMLNKSEHILPISEFSDFCKTENVKIGIIAVGEGSAQEVCDLMVKNQIRGIWNFAPCKLKVPSNTVFVQENLALSLAHLKNQLS